jgi:uncharacterized protein (TIGR03435 family)
VKQSAPNARSTLAIQPGGRFVATHIFVRALVELAFRDDLPLSADQLVGAPNWFDGVYFDIDGRAKAPGDLPQASANTSEQLPQFLQSLLIQRFGLVAHRETRQGPVFNLVKVSSGDWVPGPSLHSSSDDCKVDKCQLLCQSCLWSPCSADSSWSNDGTGSSSLATRRPFQAGDT